MYPGWSSHARSIYLSYISVISQLYISDDLSIPQLYLSYISVYLSYNLPGSALLQGPAAGINEERADNVGARGIDPVRQPVTIPVRVAFY